MTLHIENARWICTRKKFRVTTVQPSQSISDKSRTVPVADFGVELGVAITLAVAFTGRNGGGSQHTLAVLVLVQHSVVATDPVKGRVTVPRFRLVGARAAVAAFRQT